MWVINMNEWHKKFTANLQKFLEGENDVVGEQLIFILTKLHQDYTRIKNNEKRLLK